MISSSERGQMVHRLSSILCVCGAVATTVAWCHGGYTLQCDAHPARGARRVDELDSSFRLSPHGFYSVPGFGLLHHTEITRTTNGKVAAVSTWSGHRRTFIRTRGLTWAFSSRCAWRAVYLRWNQRQFAHLGLDPTCQPRPAVFGSAFGRSFRLELPTIRWRMGMSRATLAAYRLQGRIFSALDGRR